jgi:hypothetical protein
MSWSSRLYIIDFPLELNYNLNLGIVVFQSKCTIFAYIIKHKSFYLKFI